jgi:4'-phosphopantetheinyl transferase
MTGAAGAVGGLTRLDWVDVPDPIPPGSLAIPAGVLHLWRFALDLPPAAVVPLRELLSADERALADRRIFARHRDAAIVARATLRRILSGYLGTTPTGIGFGLGPKGKPHLAGPAVTSGLAFNLSHSGDRALLAVGAGGEIGVDIERIRPDRDLMGISTRFFSPVEISVLRAVHAAEPASGFYHCWVRKEAYLKARGDGLTLPLDSFDVTLPPEPANLLRSHPYPGDVGRLVWRGFEPEPGYAGAVVTEGEIDVLAAFAVRSGAGDLPEDGEAGAVRHL